MADSLHIAAASAFVTNAAGDVLLVLNPKRGWEPPGGKVEAGESLIEAVAREVWEESGVVIEVGALTGVYSNIAPPPKVIFNFLAVYVSGDLTPSDESPEVRWFKRADVLAQITHPALRRHVTDALNFTGTPVYVAYTLDPYVEREVRGGVVQ